MCWKRRPIAYADLIKTNVRLRLKIKVLKIRCKMFYEAPVSRYQLEEIEEGLGKVVIWAAMEGGGQV